MSWEAPAGVPWLVWLVIMLIFGPPALGSKIAAKLPGVLGVTGRWWQARKVAMVSQDELARLSAELHALREDYDRDVPALRGRVDALERALDAAQRRLWAALDHVRVLRGLLRLHAPHIVLPDPPEDLD
ncbi:hypothetical protein FK268_09085 [Tsukamurella sputi]|uniref:Uncharacterized protein n=1 Tax=Tsukamurella sputi TaxID=2591848 RepID=A0A5C5RQL8_9ACTN|nr:hypothetical protein [Tsukamurella sputi]TWS25337.1 hypothetical protein FK268_09085 [Tsukamurella sputi]